MLGPCNEHTDVNALDCIQRLYKHCRRVSTYCLYIQLSYITSLPSTLPFYVGSFHFSGWGRQLVPRGDAGFGVATAYPVHKDAADLNLNKVCFY